MSHLETLLRRRFDLQRESEDVNARLVILNERIRKRLKRMGVRKAETKLGTVMVVRNKFYIWDEKAVLRWYKKEGYAPPVRKVFNPADVEKAITRGLIDQSMLKEWTEIKKGKPYVKVLRPVRRGLRSNNV